MKSTILILLLVLAYILIPTSFAISCTVDSDCGDPDECSCLPCSVSDSGGGQTCACYVSNPGDPCSGNYCSCGPESCHSQCGDAQTCDPPCTADAPNCVDDSPCVCTPCNNPVPTNPSCVPEFSTITGIIAMLLVLAGTVVMGFKKK